MTLQDIREKKFPRAFKGYSDAEVDLFVAQVSAAFEQMEEELKKNRDSVEKISARLAEYESIDREMRGALLAAQKAAGEIIDSAHEQKRAILEEAEASLAKTKENAIKLTEQTEEKRKQVMEKIEEQALAMRIKHARDNDALKQEIRDLEAMRAKLHDEIETMLRDNIGLLNAQLQNLATLPPASMLEPEQKKPEETAQLKDEPKIGFAPYSPADIPGAEADEALPKLDFQT
ncbi:MAG: DivIVA domain-containing protein [Bacillota bacterium]